MRHRSVSIFLGRLHAIYYYRPYIWENSRVIDSVFSVGIRSYFSVFTISYRYRRKIRSVHIKKGAVPPFFLKRGAMAPFLRSSTPIWKKGGRKGGKYTKKGGIDTDRNTENPANLIPAKYRYRKLQTKQKMEVGDARSFGHESADRDSVP